MLTYQEHHNAADGAVRTRFGVDAARQMPTNLRFEYNTRDNNPMSIDPVTGTVFLI